MERLLAGDFKIVRKRGDYPSFPKTMEVQGFEAGLIFTDSTVSKKLHNYLDSLKK
jgi:hypothetical protein